MNKYEVRKKIPESMTSTYAMEKKEINIFYWRISLMQ
jgi:hypothetical protein